METCRTCAKCDFVENDSNWLDLFHPPVCWQSEITQIHLEFSTWKLKISANDGLPQKICSDCFSKFCSIHTFHLACQEAQLKLWHIFDKIETGSLEEADPSTALNACKEANIDVDAGDDDLVEFLVELPATQQQQQVPLATVSTIETIPTATTTTTTNTAVNAASTLSAISADGFIETLPASTNITTAVSTPIITNNTAIELLNVSFTCKYCFKPTLSYHSQQDLLAHMTTAHDSQQPYNCPECEICFQDAASRTVHLKSDHVEKHYACLVCGKKYGDRSNLRHHVEKYHSETDFECNMCEKRFFTRKSLNYHMKWHNPERQFKCSYCDRLFINRRHQKCHEATHTGMRNIEYCSYCGKAFIHLKTLRWHIYRQHGGEKPFKCGSCTEVFASYAEKRVHMLDQHAENLTAIERSECMLCRKQYTTEQELQQHMLCEHIQRKPAVPVISNNKRVLQPKRAKQYTGLFACPICEQRFNMKSALERHAAVHSTEGRPHGCTQCSKRFKRAQDMKWHMKTHSNEKPNVCDVCGKAFALKYVLTQHKRSHEVLEKNFKCATCGRTYLFEKSLRLHERVHTGKTYYKCDLCGENFVTHIKFKYHMQKMHNGTDNELPFDDLINIVIT